MKPCSSVLALCWNEYIYIYICMLIVTVLAYVV